MRRSRLLLFAAAVVFAGSLVAADAPLPPATRTIVLVRHGHYVADAQDSAPGPGLSMLGIAQAKLVAARLASMPGTFDSLDVSPLTRAADTGAIIDAELTNLHARTVAELAECSPRTRRTEITAKEKPEAMKACEERLDALFRARFVPAQGSPRREILVCHGNVIRYLVTRALGVDTQAWLEMSVAHASLTTVLVEADGRFKVIAIGDIGHVPPNLQTGSTGMTDKTLSVPR